MFIMSSALVILHVFHINYNIKYFANLEYFFPCNVLYFMLATEEFFFSQPTNVGWIFVNLITTIKFN